MEILSNNTGQIRLVIPDSNGSVSGRIPNVTTVIENEQERIANEEQRIANEQTRISNENIRIATGEELSNLITTIQTMLDNDELKGDKGDTGAKGDKRR